MLMPAVFIRAIMSVAEPARTGLIMELISGGAPLPLSQWHPLQFNLYRSEPCSTVVCSTVRDETRLIHPELESFDSSSLGPSRPVFPMLVSSKVRPR